MVITIQIQSDMRPSLQFASIFRRLSPATSNYRHRLAPLTTNYRHHLPLRLTVRAFSNNAVEKVVNKPSICTADELHYVHVANSDWRLALWRYHPNPQARARNHPLLLLSGVGTNAIGYDLSPESSFARHMSGQGFDTWILEVRGAGLSMPATNLKDVEQSAHEISSKIESAAEKAKETAVNKRQSLEVEDEALVGSDVPPNKGAPLTVSTIWDESELVTKLTETFMRISQKLSGFLSEGQSRIMSARLFDQLQILLEDSHLLDRFNETREKLSSLLETSDKSSVASQITDLSEKLVNIFEESQNSVSPQLFDLQTRFFTTIEEFQKQLDVMVKYDWDFDHYLEEDIPAVMEYIRAESKPKDGKLFAIGHSMGGILLYGMLSRCGYEGKDPGLAAVVTLASSLDYTTSKSSLKMLLPLANPAQILNVPVVPLGAMLSAAYPFSSSPPYVLSWLNNLISAEDMMDPELLKKLVLNNFCTISAKLLLQLTTALQEGGLRDRSGTFFYKDHLQKNSTPVLALAGDQDLICPPEAVYDTVKAIPENMVTYKVFGQPGGPHYAHYDLVGGRLAVEEIYPCIVDFLSCND
ncbi:uncharacterized protein [Spinacia oleracea]|uniref:Serine aminopeptidase S33 domain-containing protein n=1 Tax=Spinacia oleracea TaxID=3562 RepID=A0A9R0JX10_SPIOL|nr:uncharacterized protein LOC110789834 [Spinacia oleracea]